MSFDRRLIVLAALVAAPVVVVSCSLPPDDRPTRLNADDLGPELVNPTTTTTTTVAPSTVPPSTEPGATRPTQPPTTEPGFATAPQQLVYTLGSSEVAARASNCGAGKACRLILPFGSSGRASSSNRCCGSM